MPTCGRQVPNHRNCSTCPKALADQQPTHTSVRMLWLAPDKTRPPLTFWRLRPLVWRWRMCYVMQPPWFGKWGHAPPLCTQRSYHVKLKEYWEMACWRSGENQHLFFWDQQEHVMWWSSSLRNSAVMEGHAIPHTIWWAITTRTMRYSTAPASTGGRALMNVCPQGQRFEPPFWEYCWGSGSTLWQLAQISRRSSPFPCRTPPSVFCVADWELQGPPRSVRVAVAPTLHPCWHGIVQYLQRSSYLLPCFRIHLWFSKLF